MDNLYPKQIDLLKICKSLIEDQNTTITLTRTALHNLTEEGLMPEEISALLGDAENKRHIQVNWTDDDGNFDAITFNPLTLTILEKL
tara:strand:+ start:610 stop:870 length:261 start_codon:yes stop_codon:yes gene_type:complete